MLQNELLSILSDICANNRIRTVLIFEYHFFQMTFLAFNRIFLSLNKASTTFWKYWYESWKYTLPGSPAKLIKWIICEKMLFSFRWFLFFAWGKIASWLLLNYVCFIDDCCCQYSRFSFHTYQNFRTVISALFNFWLNNADITIW